MQTIDKCHTIAESLEESVVRAMDGTNVELFRFLPFILQDLWEIGTSVHTIEKLVQKHTDSQTGINVLDLGCGKGAVSIHLAKELGCTCVGIDAVKEFIDEANARAGDLGVGRQCRFEAGDIRKPPDLGCQFEVVVLGSIGPVFGDHRSTLSAVAPYLTPDGLVILEDGYIEDDSSFTHPSVAKRAAVLKDIESCQMELVGEVVASPDDLEQINAEMFETVKRRCEELIEKHPDQRRLFEEYIEEQVAEIDVLETKIVCSTMVIRPQQR